MSDVVEPFRNVIRDAKLDLSDSSRLSRQLWFANAFAGAMVAVYSTHEQLVAAGCFSPFPRVLL